MKNTNKITGKKGEDAAVTFLYNKGYTILERNYRAENGEIDIIAWDEHVLVFVEVKSCTTKTFGAPETWVNEAKQLKIGRTAQAFLASNNIDDVDCRFDVIAIDFMQNPKIKHIKDAFWIEDDLELFN